MWFEALYETPLLFSGILDDLGIVLDANQLSVEGCGLVARRRDRPPLLGVWLVEPGTRGGRSSPGVVWRGRVGAACRQSHDAVLLRQS